MGKACYGNIGFQNLYTGQDKRRRSSPERLLAGLSATYDNSRFDSRWWSDMAEIVVFAARAALADLMKGSRLCSE
jgi:hypothetical protein